MILLLSISPYMDTNIPSNDTHFDTPENLVNREEELEALRRVSRVDDNLYVHGSRGSGKTVTALSALNEMNNVNKVYVPCIRYDTQYKVLGRILYKLTGEKTGSGYHASDLKRELNDLFRHDTVVVLDEADFLLENDGGDTLYYLSRAENSPCLVVISSNYESPNVDERVRSSLYHRNVEFEDYTEKQVYRILCDRTPHRFEPSVLKHIASRTRNVDFALYWLNHAHKKAEEKVDTNVVDYVFEEAVHLYWDSLLQDFSGHHHVLVESISRLASDGTVNSGTVYEKYEEICREKERERLSERRVSDFMKHLELLGIIEAEYHYGGENGKTREIRLNKPLE